MIKRTILTTLLSATVFLFASNPSRAGTVIFDFSEEGINSLAGENNTTYLAAGLQNNVSLTDTTSGQGLVITLSSGTGNQLDNVAPIDIGIGDTQSIGSESAVSWGRGDIINMTFNQPVTLMSVYVGNGNSPRTITVQPNIHTTSLAAQVFTFVNPNHGANNIAEIVFDDTTVLAVGQVLTLNYPSAGIPDGNEFVGRISGIKVNAVPEPSTILLAGLGLIGLCGFRIRFRRK